MALPRPVIRRLAELAELELPFQRLAIAHELDPDGPAAGYLPALRAGPRPCTAAEARTLVGPPARPPRVRRAARILDALSAAPHARPRKRCSTRSSSAWSGSPELVPGEPRSLLPARGLAVVIMFREMAGPIPGRYQLVLWVLVALDVMVVAWMLAAGEWLDRTMPVVTLGGHHLVVLWLAVSGFALLAGMALLTGGFAVARRWHLPFVVLCGARFGRGPRRGAVGAAPPGARGVPADAAGRGVPGEGHGVPRSPRRALPPVIAPRRTFPVAGARERPPHARRVAARTTGSWARGGGVAAAGAGGAVPHPDHQLGRPLLRVPRDGADLGRRHGVVGADGDGRVLGRVWWSPRWWGSRSGGGWTGSGRAW